MQGEIDYLAFYILQNLFKRKNITSLTDEQLVDEYKKTSNKKYVGELFARYNHLVYGVCLKYLKNVAESQDMAMHVFEKLMDTLLDKEVNNFKPWLHVVTRNYCLMKLRKEGRLKGVEQNIDDISYRLSDDNTIEQVEVKEAQLQNLELAIKQLKPDQQKCIELFYIKEKCYQEVAEITGFSLKQVKSYIQNGKRNIKLILQKNPEFNALILTFFYLIIK